MKTLGSGSGAMASESIWSRLSELKGVELPRLPPTVPPPARLSAAIETVATTCVGVIAFVLVTRSRGGMKGG